MSIDFTKPLQTRDGKKVRLLCTDAREPYPVIALIEETKLPGCFTSDGRDTRGSESSWDLINVPEEVMVDRWMNVYPESAFVYNTKELAIGARDKGSVTLHIKRTVPVGHVDE